MPLSMQFDSLGERDWKTRPALSIQYAVTLALAFFLLPDLHAQADQPSGRDMVDALHSAFGDHHARAVHAKGEIVAGTFKPSGEGARYTIAPHLQKSAGTLKVIARFSNFTGIPNISDTDPNGRPKGFAVRFILPDGRVTDIVCHNFDGFPTSTSAEFAELLRAIGANPSDPQLLKAFLATHPTARAFLTTQKPLPVSWATTSYFGVNAFRFTDRNHQQTFIRYRFVPLAGESYLSPEQQKRAGTEYLMEELPQRLARGPVRFEMQAQIAEEGDVITDPSVPWPETRRLVHLGVVTLNTVVVGQEADRNLQFEPASVLPGIAVADPMLQVRHESYPVSASERQ